jgi:hypothetical protein
MTIGCNRRGGILTRKTRNPGDKATTQERMQNRERSELTRVQTVEGEEGARGGLVIGRLAHFIVADVLAVRYHDLITL